MTPSKTQPALLGGLAIGVLSALPVIGLGNLCCCAWILFGGGLAAYLLQQNHPEPINVGDGAVVGLLAGMFGALVWGVISVPLSLVMAPFQSRMMQRWAENASDLPPFVRDMLGSPAGTGALVGLSFLFFVTMFFVSSLFGLVGGLFGALFFRKAPTPMVPPIPEQ